ncbi:hypothetical protein lerEdw1_007230, partial [Lerista edwardsae]
HSTEEASTVQGPERWAVDRRIPEPAPHPLHSSHGGQGQSPPSSFAFRSEVWGSDMSSQETPQARRFPIEAGDSPSLATAPETQEPVAPERTATRQLRRCPGCHCLTLPNVPIDVYIAMGGSHRPRTT